MTLTTEQYTEGLCGDGAAILCDGVPMSVSEILAALNAANRKAQPVALDVIARFKEWNTGFPVEKFKADYVIGWVLANYYAPPAPAVPDNLAAAVNRLLDCDGTRGHFSAIRCSDAREEVERLLAQPVSSGYTFNSPVIPDGWKLVPIDATRAMIDAAQRVEEDGYDAMHKAMLAAAPESGNDHDTRR
ncbi:hypothetical protein [Serratia bockelmannii]|uniref:hypothetical protein n=1 Tax=Serratia bockelmannii TaxID=2703793 RepID=UPI003FA6A6DD